MDTNRISIIRRDLSEGTVAQPSTLKGFTIIKAPKGPIDPVLIPAQSPSLVYEILGYTSKDYPHIQEVLDFNKQFDIYVSAPYSTASSVPVAYVTSAGIFPAADPVALAGVNLSEIKEDSIDVEGINTFVSNPTVLVPIGIESSLFKATGVGLVSPADASAPLTFNSSASALSLNFGFNIGKVIVDGIGSGNGIHVLNGTTTNLVNEPARILKKASSGNDVIGELVFDIPGENLITLAIKDETGTFALYSGSTRLYELDVETGDTSLVIDGDSGDLEIVADTLVSKYFSESTFSQIWGDEDFLNSVKVYWKATLDGSSIKATIYPKYVSARTINIALSAQTLGNRISFTASEQVTPTTYSTKSISGSLLENDKDGFGASLGFSERLENQQLVEVVVIEPFDESTVYTATKSVIAPSLPATSFRMARGVREIAEGTLDTAWEAVANNSDYEHVEVFFYPEELEVPTSAFFELAESHKLSRFVASVKVEPEDAISTLAQLALGYNYFITTNSFLRKSSFTKEDYWSPLTGATAAMYLACVDQKMGGVAPMYLNSNGLGGQLGISVKKPMYKYTKNQLTYLDNSGYNPIIRDQAYGVMLVGQKTANSGELSDWSYIGHTSAFLKLLREVRDNVMIPQLGKPNNAFYRELRKNQIDSLLRLRTEGGSRIWAQAVCDTSTVVNTDDILRDRKFAIVIKVKVDIFSEAVELTLINYAQGTEIV